MPVPLAAFRFTVIVSLSTSGCWLSHELADGDRERSGSAVTSDLELEGGCWLSGTGIFIPPNDGSWYVDVVCGSGEYRIVCLRETCTCKDSRGRDVGMTTTDGWSPGGGNGFAVVGGEWSGWGTCGIDPPIDLELGNDTTCRSIDIPDPIDPDLSRSPVGVANASCDSGLYRLACTADSCSCERDAQVIDEGPISGRSRGELWLAYCGVAAPRGS